MAERDQTAVLLHGDGCSCTRCFGFQAGNELAVAHGAYAVLKLGPRTAEIADELRPLVPRYRAADEPVLQLYALTLARIEAAAAALDGVDRLVGIRPTDEDEENGQDAERRSRQLETYLPAFSPDRAGSDFQRLRDDLKGWIRLSRQLATDLGMTTTARARMGLDVAQTARALNVHDLVAAAIALDDEERGS